MDSFQNWIYSLCGAGIIASVFKILVSNSNVKKSVNIFLSVFVFLYTIIPIESIGSNLDFNIDSDIETKSYEEIYKDGYESIIINSIKNVCKSHNVTISKIKIDSYVDEDGYLVVNKIELELSNSEKNEIINTELKEKFNYEVIFI